MEEIDLEEVHVAPMDSSPARSTIKSAFISEAHHLGNIPFYEIQMVNDRGEKWTLLRRFSWFKLVFDFLTLQGVNIVANEAFAVPSLFGFSWFSGEQPDESTSQQRVDDLNRFIQEIAVSNDKLLEFFSPVRRLTSVELVYSNTFSFRKQKYEVISFMGTIQCFNRKRKGMFSRLPSVVRLNFSGHMVIAASERAIPTPTMKGQSDERFFFSAYAKPRSLLKTFPVDPIRTGDLYRPVIFDIDGDLEKSDLASIVDSLLVSFEKTAEELRKLRSAVATSRQKARLSKVERLLLESFLYRLRQVSKAIVARNDDREEFQVPKMDQERLPSSHQILVDATSYSS